MKSSKLTCTYEIRINNQIRYLKNEWYEIYINVSDTVHYSLLLQWYNL